MNITSKNADCLKGLPIRVEKGFAGLTASSTGQVAEVHPAKKNRQCKVIIVVEPDARDRSFMPGAHQPIEKTVSLPTFLRHCTILGQEGEST
jgi:hypothetical protein